MEIIAGDIFITYLLTNENYRIMTFIIFILSLNKPGIYSLLPASPLSPLLGASLSPKPHHSLLNALSCPVHVGTDIRPQARPLLSTASLRI